MTNNCKMMIYASLFAALTAAGAYIPTQSIGHVNIINFQNLFVLLTGLTLGGKWGAASIGLYLIAGAIGIPVFAGGPAGIKQFTSPAGGYLIGFLLAAYITGIISSVKKNIFFDIIAMIIGSAIIYISNITWFVMIINIGSGKALCSVKDIISTFRPLFLIQYIIEIAAAAHIIKVIRKAIKL